MPETDATPTTTLPDALDAALGRLAEAISRLRASAERRTTAQAGRAEQDDELALMQDDRSRLAGKLDEALARAEQLKHAHVAALERLDCAEASIEAVLRDFAAEDAAEKPAGDGGA